MECCSRSQQALIQLASRPTGLEVVPLDYDDLKELNTLIVPLCTIPLQP